MSSVARHMVFAPRDLGSAKVSNPRRDEGLLV